MKKLLVASLALTMLLGVVTTMTSCNKKKDTIAIVTVHDQSGNPVGGATVQLVGSPSDPIYDENEVILDMETTTDAMGRATFNFNDFYKQGQAGFAVLDIVVNGNTEGIIKVVEEETAEETVSI